MPDVFASITQAPRETLDALVDALEMRAAEPQLQAMLNAYLAEVDPRPAAQVLEVGSGTGPVARALARRPGVGRVVGLDPSPLFVAKAVELGAGIGNLSFQQGDGRSLPFGDETFDVVVLHTLLCHVPEPQGVIDEARRVLRRGGTLAAFDCDFSTASLSTGDFDPFAAIVDVMVESIVHDRWLVRRLPALLKSRGFSVGPLRSYGYVEHPDPSFMFTWVERGTDALMASGRIGAAGAQALRAEARRRVEENQWFAHVAYGSVVGRKPA